MRREGGEAAVGASHLAAGRMGSASIHALQAAKLRGWGMILQNLSSCT